MVLVQILLVLVFVQLVVMLTELPLPAIVMQDGQTMELMLLVCNVIINAPLVLIILIWQFVILVVILIDRLLLGVPVMQVGWTTQ